MQPILSGLEPYMIKPLHNNFRAYLKSENLSKQEINEILGELNYKLNNTKFKDAEYYAFMFAINTMTPVKRYSKREERKSECYYRYKTLEKTKMKRSEIVQAIADSMGVKKDCIQVYLREIFYLSE